MVEIVQVYEICLGLVLRSVWFLKKSFLDFIKYLLRAKKRFHSCNDVMFSYRAFFNRTYRSTLLYCNDVGSFRFRAEV